jgi:nitrogen regulatory protein PII
MTYKAKRVSIVTEKLNEREIERIVEETGATGYTVFEGSGKGSHGLKTRERPSMVAAFSLVKIEVIVPDRETAEAIAERVAARYFENYSGIVYIDDVEILRLEKF